MFAAIIAAGIGGVAGWLGNTIVSKQALIDQGMAKGGKMVEQFVEFFGGPVSRPAGTPGIAEEIGKGIVLWEEHETAGV